MRPLIGQGQRDREAPSPSSLARCARTGPSTHGNAAERECRGPASTSIGRRCRGPSPRHVAHVGFPTTAQRRAVFPSGARPRLIQPDGHQVSRSRSAAHVRGSAATRATTQGSRWGRAGPPPASTAFREPELIEEERSGRFGTSPLSLRRLHRVDVGRASQCLEAARSVSDLPSRSGARRRHRSEGGRACGNLIVRPSLPSSRTPQRSWAGGS